MEGGRRRLCNKSVYRWTSRFWMKGKPGTNGQETQQKYYDFTWESIVLINIFFKKLMVLKRRRILSSDIMLKWVVYIGGESQRGSDSGGIFRAVGKIDMTRTFQVCMWENNNKSVDIINSKFNYYRICEHWKEYPWRTEFTVHRQGDVGEDSVFASVKSPHLWRDWTFDLIRTRSKKE